MTPEYGHPDPDVETDRQFVTALARGLQMISAFGPEDRTLSNQDLAERTGLPRPTVSRYTHTLRCLSYMALDAATGRYSLTPRVIELSRASFMTNAIRDIARPMMEALSELGPVAVALGVPSGQGVRYLELARRPEAIVLNLDQGALVPILQTAIGRAYLGGLSSRQQEAVLAKESAGNPAGFATLQEQVKREIVHFASEGYARSFGGWLPELNAIATAIRPLDDSVPLLMSVSGLSSIVTAEVMERDYANALMSSAQIIQRRMRRAFQSVPGQGGIA